MGRLTFFELQKVWYKRSYQFAACVLLLVNLFFLWYTNLGDNRTPELRSYKLFSADTAGMTETEKETFVANLKQTIDGVSFVGQILAMRNSEIGVGFADQEMAENPGVFETYYDLYESGSFLRYTDSLELESRFISEMYAEEGKAADYDSWLDSVQKRKETLNGISVFASQDTDSFASRNIEKSAEDFKSLSSDGIKWTPSKPVVSAMKNVWTDILLILLSFLFIGGLITDEKQKGLFYITRSTMYGRGFCIASKLLALLIHCLSSAAFLYFSNCLYYGFASGWCDVTAKLQSLAPYLESSLPVSILEFIALSVVTKALVLFAVGAVLTAFCILSENMVLPYFGGMLLWAVSWALYRLIPAASKADTVKYVNLFGALRAEDIYGTYLNLNLWGYPVSRITLSWLIIGIVLLVGAALSFLFFVRGEKLGFRQTARPITICFHPHASLFRYEGYKLLVTNHGLLILLVFGFLIGYNTFNRTYTLTTQEQYYQNIMLQLEGEMTEEKADLMEAESERYREAFAEIENIDRLVASGEIDSETGNAMKAKWYGVTAFYPEFQRAEEQLELVRAGGGKFVYDTGYLYLFGVLGGGVLSDFLLLTIGVILAFSHVISMEYQCGAWALLCATASGKRGVIFRKIAVCGLASSVFFALPFVFRWISIARVFPIHGLLFPAQSIPFCQALPSFIPIAALIGLKVLLQAVVGLALAFIMIGLSRWRKNHVQAIFFGLLLLCAPIILAALEFEFAQNFSLYPLYSCAWPLTA